MRKRSIADRLDRELSATEGSETVGRKLLRTVWNAGIRELRNRTYVRNDTSLIYVTINHVYVSTRGTDRELLIASDPIAQ